MRTNRAIVCLLGGLTLATLAGAASAQPVTFQADLIYEKIVDGPREKSRAGILATSQCSSSASTMSQFAPQVGQECFGESRSARFDR